MEGISIGTIKSMSTMLGIKFPEPQEPSNRVAEFVNAEIDKLMPTGADQDILDIIKGIYVNAANANPNDTLKTLVMLHEDITVLVMDIQAANDDDEEPEIVESQGDDEADMDESQGESTDEEEAETTEQKGDE